MKPQTKLQVILCLVVPGLVGLATGCGSDRETPATPAETSSDSAPPLAPTGLSAPKVDQKGFAVTWQPNAETDLAGYRVYVYDPDPSRDQSYVPLTGDEPLTKAQYVYRASDGSQGEIVYIRVSALDGDSNESLLSQPLGVTLSSDPGEIYDDGSSESGGGRHVSEPAPPAPHGSEPDTDGPRAR